MLSTAMNDVDPVGGPDNYIDTSLNLSLSQVYVRSKSEDAHIAQLPCVDKKKPLEGYAKDLIMISDSDQQRQQQQQQHHHHQHQQHRPLVNSTSCSSCFSNDILTQPYPVLSQQARYAKKSFEAPSSAHLRGYPGDQGLRAARQRFILNKIAKLQEAKAVSEALIKETQTSVTSHNPFNTPPNQLGVLSCSSNMSPTSLISAQQTAASQPLILLPPRSSHARNLTFSTAVINSAYNRSSSHDKLYNESQHPRPHLPNDYAYPSPLMTGHSRGAQNNWGSAEYLFIKVSDLPENVTTRDLWEAFKHEGHIAYIRLHENARGYRDGGASIKFRYASDYGVCSSRRSN